MFSCELLVSVAPCPPPILIVEGPGLLYPVFVGIAVCQGVKNSTPLTEIAMLAKPCVDTDVPAKLFRQVIYLYCQKIFSCWYKLDLH